MLLIAIGLFPDNNRFDVGERPDANFATLPAHTTGFGAAECQGLMRFDEIIDKTKACAKSR